MLPQEPIKSQHFKRKTKKSEKSLRTRYILHSNKINKIKNQPNIYMLTTTNEKHSGIYKCLEELDIMLYKPAECFLRKSQVGDVGRCEKIHLCTVLKGWGGAMKKKMSIAPELINGIYNSNKF